MLLVVGSSGLVGRHIAGSFRDAGRRVHTASHHPGADLHLDLTAQALDLGGIPKPVTHAVVCSGITDVDRCRREPAATRSFNVDRITALLAGLQARGIVPIFCSSDLVFTGDRGGYRERDLPAPLTEYGRQKRAVEEFLSARNAPFAALRMSKIYSRAPAKGSVVHDTLAALRSGTVRAATDQIIVPTSAEDVARTVMAIMDRGLTGFFHVTPHDRYARYDFVRLLAATAAVDPGRIAACSLDDIAFADPRPKSLWLDGAETQAATGVRPVELSAVLKDLIAQAPALATAVSP